ncbi:MAG: hypothetical protein OSB12_07035, partial [Planctomycetota bacterium]|nr:hypothetical protein [Planctomycetota bacterium]
FDQDPFDQDPFDPFSTNPFVEAQEPQLEDNSDHGFIHLKHGGRISIVGPGDVPHLELVGTLRLDSTIHTQQDPSSLSGTSLRRSDIRIEGSALEKNHFRFRLNFEDENSAGVFSEFWIDRHIRGGLHLTGGRIANSMGLQGGLFQEDRLTVSQGLIDWISEGSSTSIRGGGRWLDDAIITDLQARLGNSVDPRGLRFGGQGISGRLSIQPFSRLLFGGPDAVETPGSRFSMFIAGRLEHGCEGRIQVLSPEELPLMNTLPLEVESARWVRAGWRWPLLEWLHLENEWMTHGLHGTETTSGPTDLPGDLTGWQFGIRALISRNNSLPTRSGPDLPPTTFDAPSPFDGPNVELLLRYERAHLAGELENLGLLDPGTAGGTVQVLRAGLSARSKPWVRWLFEATWTRTDESMTTFDDDRGTNLRLMLELGG